MERQCDALGNVQQGNLCPGTHVRVTLTRTTYLNIVADQLHPAMATVFPDGSGLFHSFIRMMCSASANLCMGGSRNMIKSSRCCLGLQIPQISI